MNAIAPSLLALLVGGGGVLGPAETEPVQEPSAAEHVEDQAEAEGDAPAEEPGPSDVPPVPEQPPPETDAQPLSDAQDNALEHLHRAQELAAAGDLVSAEAEVSVAISLAAEDGTAYLERAQIRIGMAEAHADDDTPSGRRTRAALLRQASEDVESYLAYASLDADSRAWFQARRETLRRDADALDPPPEPEPEPAPRPFIATPTPAPPIDDNERPRKKRRPYVGLVSAGAIFAGTAAGLGAFALKVERSCAEQLCGIRWRAQPTFVAPAASFAALGTTAIVISVAKAPALAVDRPRRTVMITTFALGSTAAALGVVTGALASARWSAPLSPSDTDAIGTTQALANTSASSVAVALPLLSAGLTALIRHRIAKRGR